MKKARTEAEDSNWLRRPAYFRFILTVDNRAAERFARLDGVATERAIRDAIPGSRTKRGRRSRTAGWRDGNEPGSRASRAASLAATGGRSDRNGSGRKPVAFSFEVPVAATTAAARPAEVTK